MTAGSSPVTGPEPTPSDRYARWVSSEAYRSERPGKAEVIVRICGERLSLAERIADLGAGTGIVKKSLENTIGKTIVGFELDRSFIEHPRRMVVADVLRLPAPDEAFDFLVLNHLYEHVADPGLLFREAYRILEPGGVAYVSAGNRLAVMEPHYRLPFLSWLPRPLADRYLRWSGRGRAYRGIRFLTYGPLVQRMRAAGFRVRDETGAALDRLVGEEGRGGAWRHAWRLLSGITAPAREALLHGLSPQWFFLLEKPPERRDERREA